MKGKETIGVLGQWLAAFTVVVGIIIEISYGAHLGFILITAGSLIFAIATKIKYLRGGP